MNKETILITGASSGIGREIALRFAAAGSRLVLTCNRRRREGEEVARQCGELGAAGVDLLHLDTTDNGSIDRLATLLTERKERLHTLINNAGIGLVKPFAATSRGEIEQQLHVTLEGLIKTTQALLPLVSSQVINIGGQLGKTVMADMAVFCAAKFGVRGFSQALALERPDLKIILVNPDLTATPQTEFHGRPAAAVADVVWRTATGALRVASGGEVDVWEVLCE
ncbi:MAG TPA: SDR family NAD(P)-dependent oxidoreductase [Geobacteraceae bacterium]